ncbi:MAG TPA: DUF2318 domain-containing protein [Feifaniaceae bacterium]|nr:DUF2318 domain-containing protein [Feifaniaceae bacterium]
MMQNNFKRSITIALAALFALTLLAGCGAKAEPPVSAEPAPATEPAPAAEAGAAGDGLVIPVSDLTDEPQFFAYSADGKDMEIIALTASDGSVRTAFNTCQVCYGSGKAYYKVEGDTLVCQNCGNTFGFDDIAVTRGGCNPVPITEEERKEQDGSLIISASYLNDASVLFENWK